MTTPSPALGAQLCPRLRNGAKASEIGPRPAAGGRDTSFDYLRAFIVLLVLLHHSVLAYAHLSPAQPRTLQILPAPIVDPHRWAGFDVMAIFNDTFFMALMFLLSGLFAWPSLERKGGAGFLRDRLLRLGVPFVVTAAILMPCAYYPPYVLTGADLGFTAYARAWASLGFWPSGPGWFIWVLLVFDTVTAAIYTLRAPSTATTRRARRPVASRRPLVFAVLLLVVSALVYLPMALTLGPDNWIALGPFSLQPSRSLLYATFFLAGLLIGASGTESGVLARGAGLAGQWPLWLTAGLAAFALHLAILVTRVLPIVQSHRPLPIALQSLVDVSFVLCCVTISLAFIALFRRFVVTRLPLLDSLSVSSYGMYLVHYPIVIWLQFALLSVPLDPIAKGIIVFVGAVTLSWAMVVTLRRVAIVGRVI
jgi:peptidoglycan/LPS O-acetylase OafA/YrhL